MSAHQFIRPSFPPQPIECGGERFPPADGFNFNKGRLLYHGRDTGMRVTRDPQDPESVKIVFGSSSGRAEEQKTAYSPAQRDSRARALLVPTVDRLCSLYQAFGAPWTGGLTNEQSAALHDIYRLIPELAAAIGRGAHLSPPDEAPLVERLADCLAAAVDTPLTTVREICGGGRVGVYLGSLRPDIADRACALLDEAGR